MDGLYNGDHAVSQEVTPESIAGAHEEIPATYHDIDKLAADAMASGSALICWQHEDIPSIANVLVGNQTTVPQEWPGDRFDVVWVFDLGTSSNSYSFNQVTQCLLAGDSPNSIHDS